AGGGGGEGGGAAIRIGGLEVDGHAGRYACKRDGIGVCAAGVGIRVRDAVRHGLLQEGRRRRARRGDVGIFQIVAQRRRRPRAAVEAAACENQQAAGRDGYRTPRQVRAVPGRASQREVV